MPDTTAIIVTHDSAAVLPACLRSVRAAGISAIVVDNASQDESVRLAEAEGARVIANLKNQGFGRAHNQGFAAADTPLCLCLNPDVQFAPEAFERLRTALLRAPNAALAAPTLLEADGRVFEFGISPINPPDPSGAPSAVSGAVMLFWRERFDEIGGFDPNIFLFWDDNDICRRIKDAGHDILLVNEAEMAHARGGSSAPAPGRIHRSRWHQAWSRFYVFRKYGVASDIEAWVRKFMAKSRWARLIGHKARIERYEGSRDGALAFQRGETALAHEGLE